MKIENTSGISPLGVVGIVLFILKIFGLISLSWVWVLAPVWISILLFLAITVIEG